MRDDERAARPGAGETTPGTRSARLWANLGESRATLPERQKRAFLVGLEPQAREAEAQEGVK